MYNIINIILIFSLILPPGTVVADQGNTLAPEAGWIQHVLKSDSQAAELLWELFDWARDWKARRVIGAVNLCKWLTSRRITPGQIKDILIFHTHNSTLIIYPANINGLGNNLPNSNYRVYRIPRCIDIDKEWKLDVIFKHAEAIKIAERILDELEKGEIKSEISFSPEVFFWVQNILKKKLGDKPERYALERKLLLSILFQSYPDLDPEFKSQLEEFSPSGAHLGKWLDLVNADRFLLSKGIYKRPQLFEIIRQLAKTAEKIYTQIDESSSRILPGDEYGIEMNSSIHIYSSIVALARIISEFDIDKDFDKPERIAARFIFYFVEGRKSVSLLELLGFLKEQLELKELDEALAQRGSLEDFRKQSLGNILIEFFRMIPKADIHHHLDGSISPELALKMLWKYPRLRELFVRNILEVVEGDVDAIFKSRIGELQDPQAIERLKPYIEFNYKGVGEINWNDLWPKFALFTQIVNTSLSAVTHVFRESSLEDFYNDGLTLIEHKVSIITPGQEPGIDPASILEAAVRGLIEAEEAAGGKLQTGLIPCIWKDPRFILGSRYAEVVEKAKSDPDIILREAREEALRQVKIVVDLKKRWEREKPEYAPYLIGIDTVGDEKDYIREVTAPALQYAAENGLNITEHLGENWNKGELKQALLRIRQGIKSGIIKRIGHATALGIETEDEEIRGLQEEIKELIRKNNIHIETCPSSNKLLAPEKSIPRYKDHPVVRFYRELGNVSINTDDSWILHTRGLSGEFMKVWLANPQLKYTDIQKIIENGFKASFIKAAPAPINPQELIKKGLDELLELVPRAPHEILAHNIFDLLMHCFVFSKGSPRFEEYLKGTILADIARKFQDTLVKNSAAWLATRGVVKDIVGVTEILKGELSAAEREKLIDKLTEELKELFYTPLDQYRYAEDDPDLQLKLRKLGEAYPTLKNKVDILNDWLRERGEILQVRLNLDHQGTYFDLANAIEQKILFGSDPHIMYDLHDDNGPLYIKIDEANWVGYARKAGLFPWVAQVRPPKPGTTAIMIHEVKGVTSVSVCFDYFSYYGRPNLENIIDKDEEAFRYTDTEIEEMVNQIIDGLIAGNLDIRLFSLSISPAYIWPDQAELIVNKLIEGIRRYVTQRKDSGWYQKRLEELIPSPLLEDAPVVTEFINKALSTKGPEELQRLDDHELSRRLYYSLQEPGIGLPGSPAPSKDWWRHVIIHLKGAVIGGTRTPLLDMIYKEYQSIIDLLQEWLRRKQNNYLPPARPLGDTDPVGAESELLRSS